MNAKPSRFSDNVIIKNKKAKFEYELLDFIEAGIVLKGSEIKSIREGKASLQEAYCHISNMEIFIKGMNISPYMESTYDNHEPTRERKILLKKKDIEKLKDKTEQKGLTIIPVKLYINSRGFAKIELALGRGKKLHDKRQNLKEKDQKKEIKRIIP
jgi:SsrA-binding protein